jgi:hypothetical protein
MASTVGAVRRIHSPTAMTLLLRYSVASPPVVGAAALWGREMTSARLRSFRDSKVSPSWLERLIQRERDPRWSATNLLRPENAVATIAPGPASACPPLLTKDHAILWPVLSVTVQERSPPWPCANAGADMARAAIETRSFFNIVVKPPTSDQVKGNGLIDQS